MVLIINSFVPSSAKNIVKTDLVEDDYTAKTAGFHCVRFLTAVSLYFLQSLSACSGSLQLS